MLEYAAHCSVELQELKSQTEIIAVTIINFFIDIKFLVFE